MRARLRRLHSPDVFDLRVYRPPAADSFAFLLQVIVGPEGEPGEESFDGTVCTPRWLEQNHEKGDIVSGRHLLLVFEYDYDRLVRFVKTHVEQSSGETWFEVAQKLGRLGNGLLHAAIDSIGLIPEAGGLARVIGHQAGYVGVVADQTGSNIIKAVGGSASTVPFFAGLGDTSPEGLLSTGLTVAGFIPGAGKLLP